MKNKCILAGFLSAAIGLSSIAGFSAEQDEHRLLDIPFDLSPAKLAEYMNDNFDNDAYVRADGYGVDSNTPVDVYGHRAQLIANYSAYAEPVCSDVMARYHTGDIPLDDLTAEQISTDTAMAIAIFADVADTLIEEYGMGDGGDFHVADEQSGEMFYFDFPFTEDGKVNVANIYEACARSEAVTLSIAFGNVLFMFSYFISPWDYLVSCDLYFGNPKETYGSVLSSFEGRHGAFPTDEDGWVWYP